MKENKNNLLLSLLLMLCACAGGYGQDSRTLEQKIADAVKVYRPEWRVEMAVSPTRVESMNCDLMSLSWANDKRASVTAFLWTYSSEEGAAARYEEIIATPPFPGARRRAGSEKKLGGDSYIWVEEATQTGVKAELSFHLSKKGKTVLMVVGFTPEDANSFSWLIASELPAT